jgi:hypothetical protein
MSTRKLIHWLSLILPGLPIAAFLFNDISGIFENIELLASALLILSLSVAGRRLKKRLKERMERGLGRRVEDYELTSIATWMRIPEQAARASREAERYDFND